MTRQIFLPSRRRDASQDIARRWAEKRAEALREQQLVEIASGDWVIPY